MVTFPDVKHADNIFRLLGIDSNPPTRAVTTPGVVRGLIEDDDKVLNDEEVGVFRSCVGSLIYVSMDREDLAYATKELAKRLKTPTRGDYTDLMRMAKYLWFTKTTSW